MRKLWVGCLSICLLLCSCKDPYGASAKAGADIATGIAQGMNTVGTLATQGTISAQEAVNVLGYLEFANKSDEAFLTCVQTAHTNGNKAGTYTSCTSAFNTALNNPTELALIHVSNTSASQTITTIVNGVTTAVSAIAAGLGGA